MPLLRLTKLPQDIIERIFRMLLLRSKINLMITCKHFNQLPVLRRAISRVKQCYLRAKERERHHQMVSMLYLIGLESIYSALLSQHDRELLAMELAKKHANRCLKELKLQNDHDLDQSVRKWISINYH